MHYLRSRPLIAAVAAVLIAVLVGGGAVVYTMTRAPATGEREPQLFTIPRGQPLTKTIERLEANGFIRSRTGFSIAHVLQGGDIQPGGYRLHSAMSAFEIVAVLSKKPALVWVTIPEGWRKEQVAARLAARLGWSEKEKQEFMSRYTGESNYVEGVYFPDSYLIPRSESPAETADRMISRFQERFRSYRERFLEQNIRWTTGLTLASIVQREAAGTQDMPLVAGILWNRRENDMRLRADATLQYARGKTKDGWWAPIDPRVKGIDSPFNTYSHGGIPPHPIASPGTDAIEAVLDPADTPCRYYLHEPSGEIHCSETYEEHEQAIETYLQ
jgi:UPF0755 protein